MLSACGDDKSDLGQNRTQLESAILAGRSYDFNRLICARSENFADKREEKKAEDISRLIGLNAISYVFDTDALGLKMELGYDRWGTYCRETNRFRIEERREWGYVFAHEARMCSKSCEAQDGCQEGGPSGARLAARPFADRLEVDSSFSSNFQVNLYGLKCEGKNTKVLLEASPAQ